MSVRRRALALFLLLSAFMAAPSFAQDMEFSLDETGQPPAPPAEGPPSEALANALRLYQGSRYQEASVQFQRVVEGETQDAPANVQKAQFFLGKCLFHLRFYQSALAIFDEIGQQGQGHLFFGQTLQWLAQLASQLPEPAGIIEKVGRYGVPQLEEFNNAESATLYNQLLYLMGRFKYSQGEFDEAVALFQKVQRTSQWFVQARFFEGITQVRMRKAQPAIRAFRDVIDVIEDGSVQGIEDETRMLDLAWLSLGRVYYTAANKTDPATGETSVDGLLLGNAVESWNKIAPSSEYWLDAMFEASWAYFLADRFSQSLGNVHSLFSPYFEASYYPEALVLKSVVFFFNCQFDNAEAIVGQFHERYDPVKSELEEILAQNTDNQQFYEFLQRVRAGQANMSPRIRGIVSTALSDRTLLRHLEYVRVLDGEEGRLGRAPAEFKNSSIGARIMQDISVAKAYAVDQAGDLARERYQRLIRELQELMNQVDTVELEIATAQRDQISAELQEQLVTADRESGGQVEIDEEHQVWPFDGEYWRDELGFYRQQVSNKCGR